jgi:hypothetical protein
VLGVYLLEEDTFDGVMERVRHRISCEYHNRELKLRDSVVPQLTSDLVRLVHLEIEHRRINPGRKGRDRDYDDNKMFIRLFGEMEKTCSNCWGMHVAEKSVGLLRVTERSMDEKDCLMEMKPQWGRLIRVSRDIMANKVPMNRVLKRFKDKTVKVFYGEYNDCL